MAVFNEDMRVKIPATVQLLRLRYAYQALSETDVEFNAKIFINRFKARKYLSYSLKAFVK